MKLRFVWVGKTKHASIREMVADYLQRIGRFARIEIAEMRDQENRETEGKEILNRISADPFVVALDELGEELDSKMMARLIQRRRSEGTKQMTFVLGGSLGLSDPVKKRADSVIALSRMTFTHEMARLLLVEQVYRAFTIIQGMPYQK